MLYLSSKNKIDVHTAYKAIHNSHSADGGLYLPFRLPQLTRSDILAFGHRSYGDNVAYILNLFFSTGISGADVDFLLGRSSTRYDTMSHRIVIAELWRNAKHDFEDSVQRLSDQLRREGKGDAPSDWVEVAVRIAAIFAIYGILLSEDVVSVDETVDIAMPVGNFDGPMAAWYARKMGLPVGNIICGCNANSSVWDLLNLGEMSTNASVTVTTTPLCDFAVPDGLIRLIHGTLGADEAKKFDERFQLGRNYAPPAEEFELLRAGMFAAVISVSRVDSLIRNVYTTTGYTFGPYDALAYGSLLDYRAKTGQSGTAILMSERSPLRDDALTAAALGITPEALPERLQSR